MKAMLPLFCRPLGYVILLVSLFLPFMMVMQGAITDYCCPVKLKTA